MTRWEAFNALCSHLREGLLGGPQFAWNPQTPWELLVELSGRHNVAPALAWCLADETALAGDVRAYLHAVLTLNGTRNDRILDGLARVVGALNAVGIEPVLLKGAAHLVQGIYPAAGLRVLSDLDLLVPEDRGQRAATALAAIGFITSDVPHPTNHVHLPAMYDETGLNVELHTRVEHSAAHGIVQVDWFRQSTNPYSFRGLQVRLPDATSSIAHNIVHSQIDHGFDRFNAVELRQLLDVAVIRAGQESAIDWVELDHRFSAAGFADVLATYLSFAEVVFGQPVPKLSGLPRLQFFEAFRSAVERPTKKRPKRRPLARRDFAYVRARCIESPAGFVEQIVSNDETTSLRGWAVDFNAKEPARAVRIFINGQPMMTTVPIGERPDVAAALGIPGIDECGFFVLVRAPVGPADVLQAFAELRGGVFAKLHRPEAGADAGGRPYRHSSAEAG